MKRFTWMIALLLLVAMLAGCGTSTTNTDNDNDKTGTGQKPGNNWVQGDLPSEDNATKFTGTVLASSQFAEGLAVVIGGDENYGTYIINNKGEIVANLGEKLGNYQPNVGHFFSNGLMLINDLIVGSEGNVTRPEDVGVSKFYDVAFSGGYIVAEITEATYDSTKIKLGVMNTDFQWVLEPTEELYDAIGENLSGLSYGYYYEGYIYFMNDGVFFNVRSGEILGKDEAPFSHPSQFWCRSSNTYWEPNNDTILGDQEVMLDLSAKGNVYQLTQFENGIAGALIANDSAQTVFMTLINEKGEFLFEPVDIHMYKVDYIHVPQIVLEDEAAFVYLEGYDEAGILEVSIKKYDFNGNLLKEFHSDDVGESGKVFGVYIDGGVITLQWDFSPSHYTFLNTDFERLF